jgi:nitrogen fixation protein NifB
MEPEEALAHVERLVRADPRLRVVGIAGPGEPLANPATLRTLELVRQRFPGLIKCVSTNGLLLEESLPRLRECGVKAVTVTVNAVSPSVGSLVYEYVRFRGRLYTGIHGAQRLWEAQQAGIRLASRMGMVVKVNSVLIPGINEEHLAEVARAVKQAGAHLMNVLPLIPQGGFRHLPPPSPERVRRVREALSATIAQVGHCRLCRADAAGML